MTSSVSPHTSGDKYQISQELAELADNAATLGIRVVFEALSWGGHIDKCMQAWKVVSMADRTNLGVGDSHIQRETGDRTALSNLSGQRRTFAGCVEHGSPFASWRVSLRIQLRSV